MRQGKRFCAIVPARGGSKGLPDKNILDVCGKPLTVWTVEAALSAPSIDSIVVSSDSSAILELARMAGAEAIERPPALATDSAPTGPVLEHVLRLLAGKGQHFDYLVLLQPTSPLRTSEDIEAAISTLLDAKATGLISVCETEHSPFKTFRQIDGFLSGLVDDLSPFLPRQQLPATYRANGAIYITEVSQFLLTGKLLTTRTVPFLMERELSIDVDTRADLLDVERRLAASADG